jgi:hypothetical protein
MTLSESMVWSFARSVVIASVALWPVVLLVRQIDHSRAKRARTIWLLLSVFPFFVPELLIGFSYRLTATQLSLGSSPLFAATCTELLYSVLQLSRCAAVGIAVSLLLPRSEVSRESLHSWNLVRSSIDRSLWWRGWLALSLAGSWQPLMICWSVMALITFQEFETAALMQIDRHPIAWSVWLFDAHAARQPLADSLRMIVAPLSCEALLLSPALFLLMRRPGALQSPADEDSFDHSALPEPRRRWQTSVAWLCPGIVLMLLWPMYENLMAAMAGVASLLTQNSLLRQSLQQILASTMFAAAATFLAMALALRLLSSKSQSIDDARSRWLLVVLLIPGLSGSLVMSLLLLSIFQLPVVRILYDTWLPMLLGQTLAVLPKATVVVFLLQRITDAAALHSAGLLLASSDLRTRRKASSVIWRMWTSRWLLGGLVVAQWCFWDVTVSSILRPVQLEPVVTRLYNEMHYGRTEALMSLSVLATMLPLAIWFIVAVVIGVSHAVSSSFGRNE